MRKDGDATAAANTSPPGQGISLAQARRFAVDAELVILAIHTLLALAMTRTVGIWVFIGIPFLYIRLVLCAHELMHRRGVRAGPLLRLFPVAQSIFTLGYPQHRSIHLRHHRHLGTRLDPEGYLVNASHSAAFMRSMGSTERAFVQHVLARRSLRAGTLAQMAARAALFIALSLWNPSVFIVYWLALRLGMGLTEFLIHHVLHLPKRSPSVRWNGVFAAIRPLIAILIGREMIKLVFSHDEHHLGSIVYGDHGGASESA